MKPAAFATEKTLLAEQPERNDRLRRVVLTDEERGDEADADHGHGDDLRR